MLELLGLATRRQLERAVDRKQRWHGLVRKAFVPIYLKFQETAIGDLPDLPVRYSEVWARRMERELAGFLQLDLRPVGRLLEAAGFGTEKWQRLQAIEPDDLADLLDRVAAGRPADADGPGQALDREVAQLLDRYPHLALEITRRIDADSGALILTERDVAGSDVVRRLRAELATAREELRRFRRGGHRALERIRQLETQLLFPGNGHDQAVTGVSATTEDDGESARQIAGLQQDLRAREHRIAALRQRLEVLEAQADIDPDTALRQQVSALQEALEARDAQIVRQQAHIEQLEEGATQTEPDAELQAELDQARAVLKARDHTIETLREQLAEPQEKAAAGDRAAADAAEPDEVRQLRNDLKARDHTIETLREQLERAQREAEAGTPVRADRDDDGADDRARAEVGALRRDLKTRDHTIATLREHLEAFERDLGEARERLVSEVRRLSALADGEIDLKPAQELDDMDADALLGYAREVAEDLDVRRQTLDAGLQGVESVKDNYEETRRAFEEQQRQMQEQLVQLRTEVDSYRDKGDGPDASVDDMRQTIATQREQLELLSTRVRQLLATNKDLNESNRKMYTNLEEAAKRVIPLRRQIEELENLQDALQRFIRQKFDRTFTIRKLQESGVR